RRRRRFEVAFDYSAFPESIQRNLHETAAAIHARLGVRLQMGSAADVVHVGLWLHDVHKCLGRKAFGPFLNLEFEWARGTASKLMSSATVFRRLDPDGLDHFEPTALYLLSTRYVPQAARDEAISLARAEARRLCGTL